MQSRFDRTKAEVMPETNTLIKDLAKTNLAARYYLELKDLYANSLLTGFKPRRALGSNSVFSKDSDHLIDLEIKKLMKYTFERSSNLRMIPINTLDKNQEKEVVEIYKRIKSMIGT